MGWKAYQTAKIQAWIERTKGGQNPLFRAKDIKPEDYFPRSAPRHQPRLRAYREYTTKKTTTDLLTTESLYDRYGRDAIFIGHRRRGSAGPRGGKALTAHSAVRETTRTKRVPGGGWGRNRGP